MRQRKHVRPNKRRSTKYQPGRRRKFMMNAAMVTVVLMAGTYVLASFTRKAAAPTSYHHTSTPVSAPAQKAKTTDSAFHLF